MGMTGTRLEVDVHIVTGSITAVHNIRRCVENLGIEVEQIVLQPLASSYAILNEAEKELGVALMDIGGGTTDIAIFRGGDIWFSKILPIAGEHITNDIAVGLRVSYEEAERIKIQEGLPRLTDEAAEEERIEITTISEEKKLIAKRKLAKIIEPRLEELFDLAMGEIENVGYRDLIPAGIVLTGGTSLLKGLPEFVSERYDISVRRGRNPQGIHGLRDIVESPVYSTVIGLVKYAVESKEYLHRFGEHTRPRSWGLAGTHSRGFAGLFGKLLRWFSRFFRG